jgi:hypothetical protein
MKYVLLLLAVLSATPSAQSRRAAAGEPPSLSEPFYVNPSTGNLAGLEKVKSQVLRKGRGVAFFVEGSSSGVEIRNEGPQTFAIRVMRAPSPEEAPRLLRLEVLASDGGRRFVTGTSVPLDVRPAGLSYQLAPRVPLPPGEYAFSVNGLFGPEAAGYPGQDGWAFRVVDR